MSEKNCSLQPEPVTFSAGEPGHAENLEKSIRAYATKVAQNAFWLDWLDALLFAHENGCPLGFITHCRAPDVPLSIEPGLESLLQIPGLEDWAEEVEPLERSSRSWLVLSCSTTFDPNAQANHWVPCVFKEAVPESTYAELVYQKIASLKVIVCSLQSDLLDVKLEEDAEVACTMSETLHEQINMHLAVVFGECFCMFL